MNEAPADTPPPSGMPRRPKLTVGLILLYAGWLALLVWFWKAGI